MNRISKGMILALVYLIPAIHAFADPPSQVYSSIVISTGGPDFPAYAFWNERTTWGNEELAKVRRKYVTREFREKFIHSVDPLCTATTLEWLTRPEEMPVISSPKVCYKQSEIRSVRLSTGPYDGRMSYGGPFLYNTEVIERLKTEPLFMCTNNYGLYWLSYNPKVGAKELDPLCSLDWYKRRTREEQKKDLAEMQAKPGVILVSLPID